MNWIIVTSFLFFIIIGINGDINLQNIEMPNIDEIAVIKERCEKIGGKGAYEKVKEAKNDLVQCMDGFIDIDTVKNEIEEARKTGSMDEVFGKYCNKRPKVKQCVINFTDNVKLCLEDIEKQALNRTLHILEQLAEFICFRDGDRIAMFIAEGGVNCIKEHTDGIKNCVNATFQINAQQISENSFQKFLIDDKKCNDLSTLQTCVVKELEKCKDSTPANFIDALFRFIKRNAACTSDNNKTKRSVYIHKLFKRSVSFMDNSYKALLMEAIEQRCKNNSGIEAFNKFKAATEKSRICFRENARRHKIFISPFEEFKEIILNCTEDMVITGKPCLQQEEQYFPELYRKSIIAIFKFAYEHYNEITSVSSLRIEVMQCLANIKKNSPNEPLHQIPGSIDFRNGTVTEEAYCKSFIITREHLNNAIKKYCSLNEKFIELKNKFLDAIESPCKEKQQKTEKEN